MRNGSAVGYCFFPQESCSGAEASGFPVLLPSEAIDSVLLPVSAVYPIGGVVPVEGAGWVVDEMLLEGVTAVGAGDGPVGPDDGRVTVGWMVATRWDGLSPRTTTGEVSGTGCTGGASVATGIGMSVGADTMGGGSLVGGG